MSKTRYKWWGYVKAVIRAYPEHRSELNSIREQSIVPAYGAAGGGGAASRTVECVALRELPEDEMREYEAVEQAMQDAMRFPNGAERLKLIEMVFFNRTHTLQGAAMVLFISYGTAKRWHNRFIENTAEHLGLIKTGTAK